MTIGIFLGIESVLSAANIAIIAGVAYSRYCLSVKKAVSSSIEYTPKQNLQSSGFAKA